MSEDLNGLRKSAIVLLSLGEQRATEVLRRLDVAAADSIRAEMHRVGLHQVSLRMRRDVLDEFRASIGPEPEPEPFSSPPPPSIPSGDGRHDGCHDDDDGHDHDHEADHGEPDFDDAEADDLFDSVCDEHPQTIALVLAHLAPDRAGEVLARLEPHRTVEVIKQIARIEQASGGVIEQVERSLRERLRAMMGRTIRSAGVGAVAQILNLSDRKVEQAILADLEADEPHLAGQIRRVQAILEDLLVASDDDLRAVIEQLDEQTIATALRTAGERLKRKVLGVMAADLAVRIDRRMNDGSAVAVSEIEAAQQRVAEVVHRLDTAGEIEVLSSLPLPSSGQPVARERKAV